mgnify:CR=1 FL=1
MCTFDSPFERCPVCRQVVLLDSTQKECAHEHCCVPGQVCPLGTYFEGLRFREGVQGTPAAGAEKAG